MKIKPIYEFLVWDNCSNNCQFCHQRNNPRNFDLFTRSHILYKTLKFIKSDKFENGSHVLIVGGEIFDTQELSIMLIQFFNELAFLMYKNTIDLLYINTNLLYYDISILICCLKQFPIFKIDFNRIKFTSSYDIKGRFRSKDDEKLWFRNLDYIKTEFPELNVVVNTILTNEMCDKILNNKFDPIKFQTDNDIYVNYIPYIIKDPSLSASRGTILKTLKYIDDKSNHTYIQKYIDNFDLPQEKRLWKFQDGEYQFCSCGYSKCGHSLNFTKYSDKGSCFVCDLKEIFK